MTDEEKDEWGQGRRYPHRRCYARRPTSPHISPEDDSGTP